MVFLDDGAEDAETESFLTKTLAYTYRLKPKKFYSYKLSPFVS